jgi:predicted enzyme related to lactoylglutathione lyase
MVEYERFDDGTPCWFCLSSPDPARAGSFYEAVLGWGVDVGSAATAGIVLCTLAAAPVAGIAATACEAAAAGWTISLRTSDLTASLATVQAAGGEVVDGPTDLVGFGRAARVADSAGAVLGLFEPGDFQGARRVGEPGAALWSELATSDIEQATRFLAEVAGLAPTPESSGSSEARQLAKGGHPIVGIRAVTPDDADADEWTLTFMVIDIEDTLVRAVTEGATLDGPLVDVGVGRHAVVIDPTGGRFGLLEPGH